MSTLLFDIGSSTAKAYLLDIGVLSCVGKRSFALKDGFTPEDGYSEANVRSLLGFLDEVRAGHPDIPALAYGTALMRRMSTASQERMKGLFAEHGITLSILSQQQESDYMVHAMVDRSALKEPMMIMNIGGGSMELVIVRGHETVHSIHIEQGVGTVHTKYPDLNTDPPPLSYEDLVVELKAAFPPLPEALHCRYAFNTGGELTWTSIAKYALQPNTLFTDKDHPSVLGSEDWNTRSEEIYTLTIEELKAFVPDNPQWMMGARGFMALTSAVIAAYGIEALIPSDSNLIDGIARTLR